MSYRRRLAMSEHWFARGTRALYRFLYRFSVPAPRWITRPVLAVVVFIRTVYYYLHRLLISEPLFKAYCTRHGRNLHTGKGPHWVHGQGDLIIGDDVSIDGACSFFFAARYKDRPRLEIGDRTGIGHRCSFVVGKQITIGRHCRLGAFVSMFDSPGHPLDPEKRKAGAPANAEDVRPISVGDNVWIGTNATVFPGVSIGDNSVVATGAVVMNNVPPNVVVAGNPARQIASLAK